MNLEADGRFDDSSLCQAEFFDMKILIVKISALGDVAHAVPAALYLRRACPQARIDWLVDEAFAPLLEPLSWLDEIVPLNLRNLRRKKSLSELTRLGRILRSLRETRYDMVFDLQGNCKSGFFSRITGAPRRFGFSRADVREWPNLLMNNRRVALPSGCRYAVERNLEVARAAFPGFEPPGLAGCLVPSEQALHGIDERLRNVEGSLVVCHTGTTWRTKLWSQEHWQALLTLLEPHCMLFLTWGNAEERKMAEALCARGERRRLWPGGTLGELTALLARADLVVGCDTGPIQIAAALGTATLALFFASDVSRTGARGPRIVNMQAPVDCSPCLRRECPLGQQEERPCVRALTVEAVFNAALRLLGENEP
ncbi:MAG: lipopolysaccharide heptosyltransferase I [Deltaproteobacteria bacterium]|nr:lipopolysaccharide heptosyltransferase I [Deltaproteobacteria bacterium]